MIKLQEVNDKILVTTPYNGEFISDLKQSISGIKWNGSEWEIFKNAEDVLLNLLKKHYGYIPNSSVITVKITSLRTIEKRRDSVYFRGYPIVRATGRDSGAKVVNGTNLLDGKITSTGSVKNWYTTVKKDSTFKIEIPKSVIESEFDDEDDWKIEIIEEEKKEKNQTEIENELCEFIFQKYGKELYQNDLIKNLSEKILED